MGKGNGREESGKGMWECYVGKEKWIESGKGQEGKGIKWLRENLEMGEMVIEWGKGVGGNVWVE